MWKNLLAGRPVVLGAGILLGMIATLAGNYCSFDPTTTVVRAEQPTAKKAPDAVSLLTELDSLKKRLPDQSHAMMDVGQHFTNLWFAAKAQNWPLADFYWKETRSHLRWAVGIIPIRKDNQGREVNLVSILEAVENAPLAQLQKAIEAKDETKFVAAYRFTLEGCYSCHKASDKPYLRPQIPDAPAGLIINFDPRAVWPN